MHAKHLIRKSDDAGFDEEGAFRYWLHWSSSVALEREM